MAPKEHELCEVCKIAHGEMTRRVESLEKNERTFNDFMAWWDRGGIGEKIEDAVQTARKMVFLNKVFFALMALAGTAAGIYKALH